MTSSKRARLSLNKTKDKVATKTTTTILSLFKKQVDKQEQAYEKENKTNQGSDSEDDVTITKVDTPINCSFLSNRSACGDLKSHATLQDKSVSAKHILVKRNIHLSLKKRKKVVELETNERTINSTQSKSAVGYGNTHLESGKNIKHAKSIDSPIYNLRQCKVIEISDDESLEDYADGVDGEPVKAVQNKDVADIITNSTTVEKNDMSNNINSTKYCSTSKRDILKTRNSLKKRTRRNEKVVKGGYELEEERKKQCSFSLADKKKERLCCVNECESTSSEVLENITTVDELNCDEQTSLLQKSRDDKEFKKADDISKSVMLPCKSNSFSGNATSKTKKQFGLFDNDVKNNNETCVLPASQNIDIEASVLRDLQKSDSEVSVLKAAQQPNNNSSKLKIISKSVMEAGKDNKTESVADEENANLERITDDKTAEEVSTSQVPYYLENFKTIMDNVLREKDYARLFDDADMKCVSMFNDLQEPSQKLYIRIFSRKLSWLPVTKLRYPEISTDISSLVEQLIACGFLKSEDDLQDLGTVLKILAAPDLKALAKSFLISGAGLTKRKIIELLLKKSQQNSISAMFVGGVKGNMENVIFCRAKSHLGRVCRLNEAPRGVFMRVIMLFSLSDTVFDDEGGGQNQLFQMLMVNIGKVIYPTYTVNRQMSVFADRAALIRFEMALQFEMDLLSKIERNKWSEAYEIYQQAREVAEPVLKDKNMKKWDISLPLFLRMYTAGYVYVRIHNQGVDLLQRLKLYTKAVTLLEELLMQDVYCIHYRGHWYERLALNLEAHLKSPLKSLEVVKRGLEDVTVRSAWRIALYERAKRICEAPKYNCEDRMLEFQHEYVNPPPETYLDGLVISDATSIGMKYQFVMAGDTNSVTLCAVEELVLEHYKHNGYPEGLHAEGSIVSNLFVLFFWDIIFMDVVDVFFGPFQSCPLDIMAQEFYVNRKIHVDERLEWLRNATIEDLITEISHIWHLHNGKMCAGINWDKFSGPETHQNLTACMGGCVIAGILDRYVKDPRHTRSGFPDLTLWNTDTKQLKICEVKGPTDRLSHKQILWIDYLLKLNVDAEVCYVKAVGSKKLKPTSK